MCRMTAAVLVAGMIAVPFLATLPLRRAGSAPAQPYRAQDVVLGASAFGVRRYSIPGVLGSGTECALPGTLHVYLKALKWPTEDGSLHLRLKGFLAFEATVYSDTWNKARYGNPDMLYTLRLFLTSRTRHNWRRELALHNWGNTSAGAPAAEACRAALARAAAKRQGGAAIAPRPHAPGQGALLDIRADLGASPDPALDLVVDGWPRSVSLQPQLRQALASAPAQTAASGPPYLVRALPYFWGTTMDHAALLLDWSSQYHEPLGFEGTIAYVLPDDAAELSAHPHVQALVAARRLTLFMWDQFAAYPGWEDYDQQMHIGHSSLSMWGRNALVLVVDIDEWLVPAQAGTTLPQLLAPGGCLAALGSSSCVAFTRHDIYPYEQLPADGAAPSEPGLWRNASGGHPLHNYQFMSERCFKFKTASRPEGVTTPAVHEARACVGEDSVASSTGDKLASACARQALCPVAPESCAMMLHVRNMFRARVVYNSSRIQSADWLWMLRTRRRLLK